MIDLKGIWNDKDLKGNEKLVLIYLASYNNKKYGYAFPKREQIAEGTGISLKTISKVLNALECKGYILRQRNPLKAGKNNIYYINKYLVYDTEENDDNSEPVPQEEPLEDQSTTNSDIDAKDDIELPVEQSTNELLINQNAKVIRSLNQKDIDMLNELDTDILIKAIDRANLYKPNGYHLIYVIRCYESIEKELENENKNNMSNSSNDEIKADTEANTKDYHNNNYSVKTKYHDTFNEHFRKYTEDELERKLLKLQAKRKELA